MKLEFGDGTDLSTFETVFGGLKGYVLGVVFKKRSGKRSSNEYTSGRFNGVGRTKDGMVGLKFSIGWPAVGPNVIIDFDDIVTLHIH